MIIINLDKAKLIGHDIRRVNRDKEFAPFDEIIAKWLPVPGMTKEEAEASRQAIRDKYAVIQDQIDAAETPDEIKAALGC